jgi:hypothetical protein
VGDLKTTAEEQSVGDTRRTARIVLDSVKDPDGWGEVIARLGLDKGKRERFFEWSEYASLELFVDSDMNVTGRILPREEVSRG